MGNNDNRVGSLTQGTVDEDSEVERTGVVVLSGRCDGELEGKGVNEGLPVEGNGVDECALERWVRTTEGRLIEVGPKVR